jgi:hypothetical protein
VEAPGLELAVASSAMEGHQVRRRCTRRLVIFGWRLRLAWRLWARAHARLLCGRGDRAGLPARGRGPQVLANPQGQQRAQRLMQLPAVTRSHPEEAFTRGQNGAS